MNFFSRIRRKFFFTIERFNFLPLLLNGKSKENFSSDGLVIFDTALGSDNLGDEIIRKYCLKILSELGLSPSIKLPTHKKPEKSLLSSTSAESFKIIAGTNILSVHEEHAFIWHKPPVKYLKNICLMGCGMNDYHGKFSIYSRFFYNKLLAKNFLHSVRDSFTENALHEIGIKNVLNTACPTMWKLTTDFCKEIPHKKTSVVVTTLTDYNQDSEKDFFLLDTLLEKYSKVFIWIQGDRDLKYLDSYHKKNELNKIGHTLQAYEDFLSPTDCDYVGTRLHAGIHALNHKKRSVIVAVDGRAVQIAKDTNLPVIRREEIKAKLSDFIEHDYATEIRIPTDAIEKWKRQFMGEN